MKTDAILRRILRALPAVLLGLAAASCAKVPVAPAGSAGAPAVIAVDVGHSKEHPGATSARGVAEFEFNSTLAQGVAQTLAGPHTRIVLIGGNGDISRLENRTAQASAAGAGFFLSIHHDSV